MKKVLAVLLALLIVLSAVACSSKEKTEDTKAQETAQEQPQEKEQEKEQPQEQEKEEAEKPDDKGGEAKKIAYLTPGLDLPFWRYLANGIENEVLDSGLNATVQVFDSRNSSETQLQNAQDAIAKAVDLIIISPTDSSSCPAVLALAEEAKIPVVIADIGTESGKYDAFIVTPNAEGSKELGEYVLKYMKDNSIDFGKAAQITGPLARSNIKARYDGFNEALEEFDVELADYKQMSNFTRAEAEGIAQDLMTTHADLGLIFVHMDEPTLGAVKAVENADKQDSVLVCGFDGTPETVDAIREGTLLAAAIQQPALMGKLSVEAAVKIFAGEKPEEKIDVPTLLVTKENCEDEAIISELEKNVFPELKSGQ